MSIITEAVRHPIETIRTAPLGAGLLAVNSGALIINTVEIANDQEVELSSLPIIALGLGGMVCAGMLMNDQLKLRGRIESILERRGYSPRIFAATTGEWCDRQTVRTVLRGTEHFDDYVELCEENKDTAEFSWLPHI